MNRFEMRERLENKLTKKRFEHSLGVEYVSGCLAMVHGADVNKALTAGLLHDCAKCLPADEKIARCKKHGVDDEDIRSAIEFHTTGRPAMSLLEKIVFVADYIEPNRKPLPEIDEIRNEAFSDIDASVAHILKNTLTYLDSGSCGDTDEMSVRTYKYYTSLNSED